MGKKSARTVPKPKSNLSPSSESPPDPLIDPSILKIAALLKTGKLTAEEMAKPIAGTGWARVPPELRPFIESPTLPKLAEVLRARPGLYWHPLVARQVTYLRRLRYDDNEWQRLGWEQQWDGTYGIERPPKQVAAVSEALSQLIEAHAGGLLPHRRLVWKGQVGRPGPKGGLKNPHPTGDPWTRWVEAELLDEDFQHLRSAFKAKLREREGKPRLKAEAKEWYRTLCQKVLEEASTEAGLGWWSGWKEYIEVHVASAEPKPLPEALETDLLDRPVTEILVARWRPLSLGAALDRIERDPKPVSLTKDGRAAYLAYAVLAALLGVTPEKIRNTITNYRRSRQRK